MNRVYRKIWSSRLGAFIAVAEIARGGRKASRSAIVGVGTVLALGAFPALGADLTATVLPTGAKVVAGAANIDQQGNVMTVQQQSQRAAINWLTFSIGRDALVEFLQPNAQAVMLNRVTGNETSLIEGALRANGQIFLLNPNGVLFSSNARVDTAGLVASTRDLVLADFVAGKTRFHGDSAGQVVNQGHIDTPDGGYVALIGRQVRNDGVISARLGSVALVAGDKVSLNFEGKALVGVTLETGALEALVANGGALVADGGTVLLKAAAAESLLANVVNNTGEIRARSIAQHSGKILLLGENGKVEVGGILDASAQHGQSGGFIETSGPTVQVAPSARVTTMSDGGQPGTWLIDPTDFNVAAGASTQSASGIGAETLQNALATGNVTIQTQASGVEAGNINVNAPLAWNSNKLTLEAHGDINVNAILSPTGSSTLDLKTGYNFDTVNPVFDATKTVRTRFAVSPDGTAAFTGRVDFDRTGAGLLTINNNGYTLINALGAQGSTTGTDLQGLNGNLAGYYALASNIDASATASWGGWGSGSYFNPIGRTAGFTGVLDGLGHVVNGYAMIGSADNLGLIGYVNGASAAVRNIGLNAINVGGDAPPNLGGLVGRLTAGSINNAFAIGGMQAYSPQSGGLVGLADNTARISQSYSNVTIERGSVNTGGLVGRAEGGTLIDSSTAAGNVSAQYGNNTGGLVGSLDGASVTNSSARGVVTSTQDNVGGLVGQQTGITVVSHSQASGNVAGRTAVGGLIGELSAGGATASTVARTAASGVINATNGAAGGLIGFVNGTGATATLQITDSFANGAVTGPGLVGGLAGDLNVAEVSGSYATGNVTATQASSFWYGGLIGRARNLNLQRSYATGNVDGSIGTVRYVGGLIGETINGNFSDIYARGNVSAARWAGGLVGNNSAAINNAYSTGQVVAAQNAGGLIGAAAGGSVSNSFWDVQTSGLGTAGATTGSAGGTGLTTADMQAVPTFTNAGWNFNPGNGIWSRRDDLNDRYPALRNFNYVERLATILIDPTWLARNDVSPVAFTTSGLLAGDTYVLMQTGTQLSAQFGDPARLGYYDGLVIAARAPNGDLTISRPLSWSDFKLNLEAAGNLNINAVLSATGSATLDMKAGYNFNPASPAYTPGYRVNMGMDDAHAFIGRVDIDRTGTGILAINGEQYILVRQLGSEGDQQSPNGTFQGMDIFANQALAADIDASSTALWNSGAGFAPLADLYYPFVGKLNGLGHTIYGLTISQPTQRDSMFYQVGIFGLADNADFSNLNLANVNIVGPGQTAALLGATINNPSRFANITVSGSITATNENGGPGGDAGAVIGNISHGGGYIANVHSSATVVGSAANTGGLVGYADHTSVSRSSNSGTVSGRSNTGGLIGQSYASSIADSVNSGAIDGLDATGGLVGMSTAASGINTSSSSGNVSGQNGVGGLVGVLDSQAGANTVVASHATGTVSGVENVGGLVGDSPFAGTVIERSYASGNVNAVRFAGGFIGTGNAAITNAYATGNVTATDPSFAAAGGFAGGGAGTLVLDRVYSSGIVTAADLGSAFGSGGLAGFGFYTVTNSFYDADKNPNGAATGLGVGKTTTQMTDSATFIAAGWDFTIGTGLWGRKNTLNNGYPVLRAFGFTDPLLVDLGVSSRQYGDANPSLGGLSISGCPVANCANLITGISWGNTLNILTHAGTYNLNDAGVLNYSFANGFSAANFEITYAVPIFTIAPRVLSVNANPGASRVYDGSTGADAGLFSVSNVVNGDTVALGGIALLDSAHAGSRSIAALGSLNVNNADYQLDGLPSGTVTITPRTASLALVPGATRVYDGSANAPSNLFALTDIIDGDAVSLGGTALLDGIHAGFHGVNSIAGLTLDSGDYVIGNNLPVGTVEITPRALALNLVNGANRIYDGSTAAGASLFNLDGVLNGDSVDLSGAAILDNSHAGTRSIVDIGTLTLNNGDYSFSALPSGSLTITPRALSVGLLPGASRSYDGTAEAGASLFALSGVLNGDSVALIGAALLDSTHVGTRSLTGTGTLASGNSDYRIDPRPTGGSVLIQPRTVGLSLRPGATRTFDSTANADAGLFVLSGLVPGEQIVLNGSALLDGVDVGLHGLSGFGSLGLSSTDYSLPTQLPEGTVRIRPTLDLASLDSIISAAQRTSTLPVSQAPSALADNVSTLQPTRANVSERTAGLSAAFAQGEPLAVLSAPAADEETEGVTLNQARRMMVAPVGKGSADSNNIRVPVSRNSLAEIVNGGVKLPGGVDQLLFVVKANK